MTLTDKLSHAAERKAFETILDNLIKKGQTQDAAQVATDLVNMVEKLHSDVWSENSFQTLRMIANDPDGKWAHYAQRLIRDNDPYILKTFLTMPSMKAASAATMWRSRRRQSMISTSRG